MIIDLESLKKSQFTGLFLAAGGASLVGPAQKAVQDKIKDSFVLYQIDDKKFQQFLGELKSKSGQYCDKNNSLIELDLTYTNQLGIPVERKTYFLKMNNIKPNYSGTLTTDIKSALGRLVDKSTKSNETIAGSADKAYPKGICMFVPVGNRICYKIPEDENCHCCKDDVNGILIVRKPSRIQIKVEIGDVKREYVIIYTETPDRDIHHIERLEYYDYKELTTTIFDSKGYTATGLAPSSDS